MAIGFAARLHNSEMLAHYELHYPLGREEEHGLLVSVTSAPCKDAGRLTLDVDLDRR